jgi:acetate---CoA ligase (ADP-forming)
MIEEKTLHMTSMSSLLDPKAVAVVGASQRQSRGTSVLLNLVEAGFAGEVYAVNPRYPEVHGRPCFPSVSALPTSVDCLAVAVAADAACDVLEEAYAHGIRAAVVMAAGFGEGGHGQARAARLQALADKGMRICGPNCFGLINLKANAALYSGPIPRPLRPGSVALVSQSGGLGATVFSPLMGDRTLGFKYFVSCGNQIGATIEDYVEYFLADADVEVIAVVVEALKHPRRLLTLARSAHAQRKSLLLFQAGRSNAGRILAQSHTGALAGNAEILAAFLQRCGIVQVDSLDELAETIELYAIAPRDGTLGDAAIIVSGSGGGAAVAADVLDAAGMPLSPLTAETKERVRAVLPDFGSVTNPIDGTGAIYDNPALLPKIFEALLTEPGRPLIAASVSARPVGNEQMRRLTATYVDVARASGRTLVAYQYSPLGGPLDPEVVGALHAARIPFLLGTANAMRVLKYLPLRRRYWERAAASKEASGRTTSAADADLGDFLAARAALLASGVAVVPAELARSEDDAVALLRRFGTAVAIKAEAPDLLHKSELDCVRLNCGSEREAAEAYRAVVGNARKAGFAGAHALVQPMVTGVAEAYAGIIDDPLYGPAICFGLGGIFVEILKDTAFEMAPLTHDDALAMIHRTKGAKLLMGARGRPRGDIEALAELLVRLGDFAVANAGRFRAVDLNPIIVKLAGEGVVAVDIAIEPLQDKQSELTANAAE